MMGYTKKQLRGMSDHIVEHVLYHMLFSKGMEVPDVTPNYCNKPNDIMPLAKQCGLDIRLGVLECIASNDLCAYYEFGDDHEGLLFFADNNYCRAIACCLILVLQEQNK